LGYLYSSREHGGRGWGSKYSAIGAVKRPTRTVTFRNELGCAASKVTTGA
jgi:hypothetical protein